MTVRIGPETGYETLAATSVVSTSYGLNRIETTDDDDAEHGSDRHGLATLGTMGPMRMDYPGTMAAVAAVARYVGRALSEG